jgi:prophage regulatory protein
MGRAMKILRFGQVKERIGYSRMHVDRLEKAGDFPKRIRLGPNSVGWLEDEVDGWIKARAACRADLPTKKAASHLNFAIGSGP